MNDMLPLAPDLEVGVATSAWQIEGAVAERGRCIWDDFADRPGTIVDGSTGEPACDHVHRLEATSTFWPGWGWTATGSRSRGPGSSPTGRGRSPLPASTSTTAGRRLVGPGHRAGRDLYHWDLPSPLQAVGGWPARDTAARFADFAGVMAERLGRPGGPLGHPERAVVCRVPRPRLRGPRPGMARRRRPRSPPPTTCCSATAGRWSSCGVTGPASVASSSTWFRQGLTARTRRRSLRPNTSTTIANQPVPRAAWPAAAVPARTGRAHPGPDRLVVRARRRRGRDCGLPRLVGCQLLHRRPGAGRPRTRRPEPADDLEVLAYPGGPPMHFAPRPPMTEMGWEVAPGGLLDAPCAWPTPPFPGCRPDGSPKMAPPPPSVPPPETEMPPSHDPARIDYLAPAPVGRCWRAGHAGLPVRGYYVWSLLDNLEWAFGWTKRFGLVRVEETATRAPAQRKCLLAAPDPCRRPVPPAITTDERPCSGRGLSAILC